MCLQIKQCRRPCSRPPPEYQDLSMHHDWHVKKAIVEGNSECTFSGNSLSSLGEPAEQGYPHYFADVTNRGWITCAMQAMHVLT